MKKIFIYIFMAFLIAGGIAVFAGPDREFSQNENRYLTKLSDVAAANVLSGEFQQQLTSYTNDQMPGRDIFMASATEIKKASGRKDIGGAYIGKDGYYFDKKLDKDINLKRYRRNLDKIEKTALRYSDKAVSAMLVPESASIYSNRLPSHAQSFDDDKMYAMAEQQLTECRLVNLKNILKQNADKALYYRTDHHWTLEGAYIGYEAFTGKKCAYDTETVCDDFLGTLYSKVLDVKARKKASDGGSADTVEIPVTGIKANVMADGKSIDMFDRTALNEKDKYRVFFGGNYGITEINSGVNDKKLVVVKDSFANCFVPLLTGDYGGIIMIDMRYFSGNIDMVAADADEILFLYELSNFAADSNISKLGIMQ